MNAWIILRHRPENEFTKPSDQFLSIAGMADANSVRQALAYTRGFRRPEPHVSRLIRWLAIAQNIEGLQLVRKTLRDAKWAAQRRMIDDELIRIGSFQGADGSALVHADGEVLCLFAACWLLWRDRKAQPAVHLPPIPAELIREHYSLTDNPDVEEFYIDSFWTALHAGLAAGGRLRNRTPGHRRRRSGLAADRT